MTFVMIQGLKKTTSIVISSIRRRKNCLQCSIYNFCVMKLRKTGVILRHKRY